MGHGIAGGTGLAARNEAPELIRALDRDDERCWVPLAPGAWFYPMAFDVRNGVWHSVFRVAPGAQLPTHYHLGRVVGCTLRGRWHYRERDWEHRPGSYLLEVPGASHTFEVIGEETVELFTVNEGGFLLLDERGDVTGITDVLLRLEQARAHYERVGLGRAAIDSLIR
ncbi:2%2C4'-dihydroxyacetophenone dioxygenase [Bordetella pertussis]|uniref:2,4'-dihydroxyacetophenone dioxygenase family protein n=1 Tax=Bordetella pertussis TaxID=520 RepID=UPI00061B8E4C|nr:2,4'-dihydroxyacetophenone dioxygenase family protein [Bordetella pertussis]CPI09520.1 2%2C4'-dihydroxyacetophenone dioxygenase [Bordetella pertussis]